MNVERIFFWLRFAARLILDVLGEPDNPGAAGGLRRLIGPPVGFKPERIQYWIGQLLKLVLELFQGSTEETGKSGEGSGAPAPEEVE